MVRRGFTLIELLIVISIIGVFAGFLFVNFAGVRERGRDSQRKNDLRQMKNALRLYYNDYQRYPTASSGRIAGCGTDGDEACAWGSAFAAGTTSYMTLPTDPVNSGSFVYTYSQGLDTDAFVLRAQLESLADDQARESQIACGVAPEAVEDGVYLVCAE